jgi:peptidoglycan/xylan/chitin deacetylase (PgdA/CDA1 family)
VPPTPAILDVPVLTYHDINKRFRVGITRVSPSAFRKQMEWMAHSGCKSIPLSEVASVAGSDHDVFSIVFDDAYNDLHDTVFPMLQRLEFKATLAVIAGFTGKDNAWEARLGGPRLRHMDWTRIRQWLDAGHDIASHGYTHRCLTGLSARNLYREIADSKSEIENALGVEIKTFVPPFGRADKHVLDSVARSGYRIVCVNTPSDLDHPDLIIVARRGIHRFDTLKTFKRKVERGWDSKSNSMGWKFTAFCSGGTILAHRLFGKKNIP